jgi:hypothetical protein
LHAGFAKAKGDVIITWMLICKIVLRKFLVYDMIVNGKYDLVSGWKEEITILLLLKIPSKLFNWAEENIWCGIE